MDPLKVLAWVMLYPPSDSLLMTTHYSPCSKCDGMLPFHYYCPGEFNNAA